MNQPFFHILNKRPTHSEYSYVLIIKVQHLIWAFNLCFFTFLFLTKDPVSHSIALLLS